VHRVSVFLGKPESPDVLTKLGTVDRQNSIGKKREKLMAQVELAQIREVEERHESLIDRFLGLVDICKLIELIIAVDQSSDRYD
jgi:hypothetical protein